jgi:hypothetical protein
MPINVFVSVTKPFTSDQENFVQSVEALLAKKGFRPNTIGRNVFAHGQPLKLIDEVMRHCAGAVVLGLRRHYVDVGRDKPFSAYESPLNSIGLATSWNQIEAAMAYVLRLPLLVVREAGVRQDGLLEHGYDWWVTEVNLGSSALASSEIATTIESWTRACRKKATWRPSCRRLIGVRVGEAPAIETAVAGN